MTRYVIGPDTALKLAQARATPPAGTRLLAPTLMRSQVLAALYARVQAGETDRREAKAQLDHLRRLSIRLLGDRVLQDLAWEMAEQLGWADTFVAEYIALTRLQADALVVEDDAIAQAARPLVKVATMRSLMA